MARISKREWMCERRWRIVAPGSELDGRVTPIRFTVNATDRKVAEKRGYAMSETALKDLTDNPQGEWAHVPVALYRIA